ncbi:MAG: hypothetical protein ACWGHH_06515 [Sulfurovaceae bacterium]
MDFWNIVNTVNNFIDSGTRVYNAINSSKSSIEEIIDKFEGGECKGAFLQSGMGKRKMQQHLRDQDHNARELQHSDIFLLNIQRQAPSYDMEAANKITSMVENINVIFDGAEIQSDAVGIGYYNWLTAIQSGEMQVVFREFKKGEVIEFLTKYGTNNTSTGSLFNRTGLMDGIEQISNITNIANNAVQQIGGIFDMAGNFAQTANGLVGSLNNNMGRLLGAGTNSKGKNGNIIPSDGTCLLPYDYYFRIKLSHIVVDERLMLSREKIIIEDDYLLDGNISLDYATGDENFLKVNATFKPIKSWR